MRYLPAVALLIPALALGAPIFPYDSSPVQVCDSSNASCVTTTDLGGGKRGLDMSVSVDLAGATISGTYTLPGSATAGSCKVSAASALTQCAAVPASGKAYNITGYVLSNGTTAQTIQLVTGSGSNCGTGQADLTPVLYLPVNGNVSMTTVSFLTPVAAPADKAVCCKPAGANPFSCQLTYFVQ